MSFEANLWCYLWDLADEGIDRTLDVIQGELGATGLSVATAYHSVGQLRPHEGVSPRWFRSAGGLQFQPDAGRYRGTRAKAVVAEWLKSRNPLAVLAEGCAKRGLNLRGWTVCCHSSVTVARNPSLATKDVFGTPSTSWLCPVNPDVQEYLRALIEDLTHNYGLAGVELESCSFSPGGHTHTHEKVGVEIGPVGRFLLSLCLCESCRQQAAAAGCQVAAVERCVTVDLERILHTGTDTLGRSPAEYVSGREPVQEFVKWRSDALMGILPRLRSACNGSLIVLRSGDAWATAADPIRIAGHCDAMIQTAYGADEARIEQVVDQVAAETGSPGRVIVGLNACAGYVHDSASLVRSVGRAAALGVRGVNIYNYGMIAPARLLWIKQAIRYGRREA